MIRELDLGQQGLHVDIPYKGFGESISSRKTLESITSVIRYDGNTSLLVEGTNSCGDKRTLSVDIRVIQEPLQIEKSYFTSIKNKLEQTIYKASGIISEADIFQSIWKISWPVNDYSMQRIYLTTLKAHLVEVRKYFSTNGFRLFSTNDGFSPRCFIVLPQQFVEDPSKSIADLPPDWKIRIPLPGIQYHLNRFWRIYGCDLEPLFSFTIDPENQESTLKYNLTPQEFCLLWMMLNRGGLSITRLELVYGISSIHDARRNSNDTIDDVMYTLRAKLQQSKMPISIENSRRNGYYIG